MKESKQLLLANRAWATELTDEDPAFFARMAQGQNSPWDSALPPE